MQLARPQIRTLVQILIGLGHICIASVFLPFLFESFNLLRILLELISAVVFWIMALELSLEEQ